MGDKAKGWIIVFAVGLFLASPIFLLEIFVDNWVGYAIIIGYFVAVFAAPAVFFIWLMTCVIRGMRK